MIRTFVLAMIALAVAACAGPAPEVPAGPFVGIDGKPLVTADGNIDNSVQEALSADPAACTKAGGAVQPVCMRGVPMCIVSFKDAGKVCSDSSECSGRCMAQNSPQPDKPAKGVCAPDNQPCGCFQTVEKGLAGYPLCAD